MFLVAAAAIAASSVSCEIIGWDKLAAKEDHAPQGESHMDATAATATAGDAEGASEDRPARKTPKEPTTSSATRPAAGKRRVLVQKRVLFIGNSYTSCNDMPLMIQKLAEAAHEQERLSFKAFTVGGCTLSRHWLRTGARLEVRKGRWDHVVLQEQSTTPIAQRETMHGYARLFDTEVLMAGAKTVFFLTWARRHRPHDQEALTDAYVSIAKELKAQVAPVGLAWQMALEQQPGIKLHDSDKSHPTRTGSYLAACVFYTTLYGRTPLGLPGRLLTTTKSGQMKAIVNLRPQEAMFCQQIAWDAVRRIKARMR